MASSAPTERCPPGAGHAAVLINGARARGCDRFFGSDFGGKFFEACACLLRCAPHRRNGALYGAPLFYFNPFAQSRISRATCLLRSSVIPGFSREKNATVMRWRMSRRISLRLFAGGGADAAVLHLDEFSILPGHLPAKTVSHRLAVIQAP